MDGLIVFAAKYLIIVPILVTVYVFYQLKGNELRKLFVAQFLITGLLSLATAQLLASLVDNPRPFLTDSTTPLFYASDDNGFPSDHTLLAGFLAFSVWQYRKRLGIALIIIAVIVGWARVAAGVHHAVDIVGSFAITALICLAVGRFIREKFLAKNTTES